MRLSHDPHPFRLVHALKEPSTSAPIAECLYAMAATNPAAQMGIIDQFLDLGVGLVNILRITGKSRPAERADAAAEQRADIGGHEAGEVERPRHALIQGDLADVVAVIDHGRAGRLKIKHGLDMAGDGGGGGGRDGAGIGLATVLPFRHRPAGRQIAVHQIVGAGLIRNEVGLQPALDKFRQNVRRITQ